MCEGPEAGSSASTCSRVFWVELRGDGGGGGATNKPKSAATDKSKSATTDKSKSATDKDNAHSKKIKAHSNIKWYLRDKNKPPPPQAQPIKEISSTSQVVGPVEKRKSEREEDIGVEHLSTPVLPLNIGIRIIDDTRVNLDDVISVNDPKCIKYGVVIHQRGRQSNLATGRFRSRSLEAYLPDVHQPRTYTHELVATANEHLIEHALKQDNHHLYRPTTEEILREAFVVQLTKSEYADGISRKKLPWFQRHCRYTRKWDVSQDGIQAFLHDKQQLISTGMIPVTAAAIAGDVATQPSSELPECKKNDHDDRPNREAGREAAKAQRNGVKDKKMRIYRPSNLDHYQDFEDYPPFVQNQDSWVRVKLCMNPDLKSYVRIRHTFNYVDDAAPDIQPHHISDVYLTHRNARIMVMWCRQEKMTS
ncbi:hypothetical protein IQ07DRAFT_636770 [Pyrenochaeta sp. DS3sAY3a]|nr:hypothetical protein IQ07DRAFT_636770 [Pyrenochaeta sp. DS3sAY3a]